MLTWKGIGKYDIIVHIHIHVHSKLFWIIAEIHTPWNNKQTMHKYGVLSVNIFAGTNQISFKIICPFNLYSTSQKYQHLLYYCSVSDKNLIILKNSFLEGVNTMISYNLQLVHHWFLLEKIPNRMLNFFDESIKNYTMYY